MRCDADGLNDLLDDSRPIADLVLLQFAAIFPTADNRHLTLIFANFIAKWNLATARTAALVEKDDMSFLDGFSTILSGEQATDHLEQFLAAKTAGLAVPFTPHPGQQLH